MTPQAVQLPILIIHTPPPTSNQWHNVSRVVLIIVVGEKCWFWRIACSLYECLMTK